MSVALVVLALALLAAAGPAVRIRQRIGSALPQICSPAAGRPRPDPLEIASTLDVFAVCLRAGMSVPAAAAVTAPIAPPALGSLLGRTADLLALGADPDTAWSVDTDDPSCLALLRLARRSAASGSALAAGVADLAEQARRDAANAAVSAAERAGVLIAGPLGLCFLPAFVCLGIVPAVVGLAGQVFTAGPL